MQPVQPSALVRACGVVQAVLPGGGHAVEESVSVVKPPALQPPVEAGEGLQADEVEQYLQYQGAAVHFGSTAISKGTTQHTSCSRH